MLKESIEKKMKTIHTISGRCQTSSRFCNGRRESNNGCEGNFDRNICSLFFPFNDSFSGHGPSFWCWILISFWLSFPLSFSFLAVVTKRFVGRFLSLSLFRSRFLGVYQVRDSDTHTKHTRWQTWATPFYFFWEEEGHHQGREYG